MEAGDLLLFTDWRGDPDERLDGPGTAVARCSARPPAGAWWSGACCGDPIWTGSSSVLQENRSLGEEIEAAGGCCLLDMRVRPGGSHHLKLVVLRHPAGPSVTSPSSAGSTCATAAGTTPPTAAIRSGSRWRRSTAPRPPWHDIQALIQRARQSATSRRSSANGGRIPLRSPAIRCTGCVTWPPARTADPSRCRPSCPIRSRAAPTRCRCCAPIPYRRSAVQLRPGRRAQHRPRLPQGAAARQAWSTWKISTCGRRGGQRPAEALRANPGLHLIAVVPHIP